MTLRVTIEIVPFGVEEDKRTIFNFDIGNMAKKTKNGRTRYRAYWIHNEDGIIEAFNLAHHGEHGALRLAQKVLRRAERILDLGKSENGANL